MNMLRKWFLLLLIANWFSSEAFCAKTKAKPRRNSRPEVAIQLGDKVTPLGFDKMGPFVNLPNRSVLAVEGNATITTSDEGKTWSAPTPLFPPDKKLEVRRERAMVCTPDGVVVLVFIDNLDRHWRWVPDQPEVLQKNKLNVWSVRSLNNGQTWTDLQLIQPGYCGAIRDMIVTHDGKIIVSSQRLLPDKARHATITHVSADAGKSWQAGEIVDVEDKPGDHAGGFEATLIEQRDRRLRLLIRTNKKVFWQAWSRDGLAWSAAEPTEIDAAHAPGLVKRLASGRQVLVWNRLQFDRSKLFIAFSDDDGKTWSEAALVASGARLAYPYLLERRPGELWITTMQGDLRAKLNEGDFVDAANQSQTSAPPAPPRQVCEQAGAPVMFPDGHIRIYVRDQQTFAPRISRDQGRTWSDPDASLALPEGIKAGQMLVDRRGNLHAFFAVTRGRGTPAVNRFIDLWHAQLSAGQTEWTKPQRIFEGYVGSLQAVYQLKSGTIVVPFAYWVGGQPSAPPHGSNITTVAYSTDGGQSWRQSPDKLVVPCPANYNGVTYGAIEPVLVQLNDNRCWMLIRTQMGKLYESFSSDGISWTSPAPSRFASSNSPAEVVRLSDGRLVVLWNNCELPPRLNGQGVYGGRDALHMAISHDEGQTWRGFREILRDARRNDTPPISGDRGTAYPRALATNDGKLLVVSGQGLGRRTTLLIDPDWVLQSEAWDDFSNGLEAWTAFKSFGPAKGWWRDRQLGPKLVPHPERPNGQMLSLSCSRNLDPDGAVWNFTAGNRGTLRVVCRVPQDAAGGTLSLTDRLYEPCDDRGDETAMFQLSLSASQQTAPAHLTLVPDVANVLELRWDLSTSTCRVFVNDQFKFELPLKNATANGISYIRLRGANDKVDKIGWQIERIAVAVDPRA